MLKNTLLITGLLMLTQTPVYANDTVDNLLNNYQQQGADEFSIEAGKALWTKEVSHAKAPMTRSCASCHGSVLTDMGKHIKTKKVIKPMAPSVNPKRLTKEAKIEKWFRRNCKWTLGRECSVQEKGDVLLYLSSQ